MTTAGSEARCSPVVGRPLSRKLAASGDEGGRSDTLCWHTRPSCEDPTNKVNS